MTYQILDASGGIIFLAIYVLYIASILRGPTVPKRATWIGYALIDIAALVVMRSEHKDVWTGWVAAVGASIVALLSFPYGERGWRKLDIGCVLAAVAAAVLYVGYRSGPEVSVAIVVATNLAASVPTYRSSYARPQDEAGYVWLLGLVGSTITLMGIQHWWSFVDAGQIWGFLAVNAIEVLILYVFARRRG